LASTASVVALANAVKGAVVDWVNYNNQMDKGALATGMQVTEFSRLVQAADDVRVSQEAITTAMSLATKNGFKPSIDSLAILADRLKGMNDPTQRAAELSAIFGRGWKEIYPLLENGGQALRDATAAQADGLLVTEESIATGEQLYGIWDTLGDSATSLANGLAKELAPALIQMGEGLKTAMSAAELLITWQSRINAAVEENDAIIAKNAETYEDYTNQYIQLALASGKLTQAEYKNLIVNREMKPIAQDFLHNLGMRTVFEYQAAQAADATAAAVAREQAALAASIPTLQEQGSTTALAVKEMENIYQAANGAAEATLAHSKAISDLKGATDDLKAAQEGWMKGAGGDVKSELEAAGVKGQDLTRALAAIDTQMGTGFVQEQAYKDNIKRLVDEYKRGGDLGEFTGGLASMKTEFMKQDEEVIKLRVHVEEYQMALDKLVAHPYTVYLNQVGNVSGGGSGGNRSGEKVGGEQYADGGSFVIPSKYGFEGFDLGGMATASGGEVVTITPANQVKNITHNWNYQGNATAQQVRQGYEMARLLG
jgi:hypothetical protein